MIEAFWWSLTITTKTGVISYNTTLIISIVPVRDYNSYWVQFSFSDISCLTLVFYVVDENPLAWCRTDVGVATFWAIAFIMLMLLSYLSLYFRHYWLSIMAIWLGILLPIRLRSCRQALVKKRERKFLLPLSMWSHFWNS